MQHLWEAVGALAILIIVLQWLQHDKLRAQTWANRNFVKGYVVKAGRDHNDYARIPRSTLALQFDLAPQVPPRDFTSKPTRHPALGKPRRKKRSEQ